MMIIGIGNSPGIVLGTDHIRLPLSEWLTQRRERFD